MFQTISSLVLTAIGAGVSILFTQWIIAQREQTKLLTDKLESLLELIMKLMERTHERQIEPAHFKREGKELLTALQSSGVDLTFRMENLVLLHFPHLIPYFRGLDAANDAVSKAIGDAAESGQPYDERIFDSLCTNVWHAGTAFRRAIIQGRYTLTKRPLYRIAGFWRRKCEGY